MPERCRDIYDDKSQLLLQVGSSRHFDVAFVSDFKLTEKSNIVWLLWWYVAKAVTDILDIKFDVILTVHRR